MDDEDVRRRAYRLWEREGKRDGADWRHWFEAEDDLSRPPFLNLFDAWKIDELLDIEGHPVAALAANYRAHTGLRHFPPRLMKPHPEPERAVLINTTRAARLVSSADRNWLARAEKAIGGKDVANAAGALGELRAYADLLETFGSDAVFPDQKLSTGARPEFNVVLGKERAIIEVHSKQMDGTERDRLRAFRADIDKRLRDAIKQEATGPVTGVTSIAPMGQPDPNKPGDTVQTNVISRIASIKEREHQGDAGLPFVLWLDLQDEITWGPALTADHTQPLTNGVAGALECGGLWHAFYGRKGKPIISSDGIHHSSYPLLHEGRFYQTMKHGKPTKVSAAVLSLPETTVIFEHPDAVAPLPPEFRIALLQLPRLDLHRSYLNWKPGLVEQACAYALATVDDLDAALSGTHSW